MSVTALVVGAGPAGLSAALGLLSCGFDVTVLEAQSDWKGRVCGAFLNPDAVRNLAWCGGLERARERSAPTAAAQLFGPRGATSTVLTAQDGVSALALSRTDLESILRVRVMDGGGKILTGIRVTGYGRGKDGCTVTARDATSQGITMNSDTLVMADGRFSLAAHEKKPDGGWYGWNATFENLGQSPGTLGLYFTTRGYVGVITFPDGSSNVCGLVRRRRGMGLSWESVFDSFRQGNTAFDQLMTPGHQMTEWRGVGPLPYTLKPRHEEGVILAGDAAGVGDPFMGEGIGRAMGTGPLIAEAFRRNPANLNTIYATLWAATYGRRFRLGWQSRIILNRPWLAATLLDPLLRTSLISRSTRLFHRGAGFPAAAP